MLMEYLGVLFNPHLHTVPKCTTAEAESCVDRKIKHKGIEGT